MYNSKISSRGTVSHDQSWTTGWTSVTNEDGEKQSERMNANILSQQRHKYWSGFLENKSLRVWSEKTKLKKKKKKVGKKNLTLTNDNCCITILWGSLCRQQGSWDRWRPIWANPQTKRAINQSRCVFMGMGCDVSVSVSLSVIGKTISQTRNVTKCSQKHRSC